MFLAFWSAAGDHGGILLTLFLVFAASKILALLASALRQPPVAGELAAGIVIGPAVLGIVQPSDFLSAMSELGVMFLLFRVGLELKDFNLTRVGADALMVAVAGVVLPFAGGYGLMAALGHSSMEAVFVGSALVATSVGITARVLEGRGLLDHEASKMILAAAIIDDVLGLLVLGVASSMAKNRVDLVHLGLTTVFAVGFVWIVSTWGKRGMQSLSPRVEPKLAVAGGAFTMAILILFGLSLLAMKAGVAAIIGAFLAGMMLAPTATHRLEEMVDGVTEFLVPFFLAGIGLHLDLQAFKSMDSVLLAAALLVIACLTKWAGCGLGAYRMGRANAIRVGVGMIPRGEVGMVVAQVGLTAGVFTPLLYGMVVLMSIASTLVAPPLLKIAFRGAESE
jgi:Kef-type K+ transport system membrane component KefB